MIAEWIANERQLAVDPDDLTVAELYEMSRAAEFSPRSLNAGRQWMINLDWYRTNINRMTSRIRRVFHWATENELIAPSVYHGLQAVSGLKRGLSEARESKPVQSVAHDHVDMIREYVARQLWAIIRLQLLTAAHNGPTETVGHNLPDSLPETGRDSKKLSGIGQKP